MDRHCCQDSSYLHRKPLIFFLYSFILADVRKFIIPAVALLVFIAGLVFMVIPFIPLGWLFVALASLLMAPYLKFMRKFIGWLSTKDKTGSVKKAGEKAAQLYQWAGDPKRAAKLETILEENSPSPEQSERKEKQ